MPSMPSTIVPGSHTPPAKHDSGTPSGSRDQTCARAAARERPITARRASQISPSARSTVVSEATDPITAAWPAQRLHVDHVAGTAGDRHRDIGEYPAPVMQGKEATPGEHRSQRSGQTGPIGEHPQRHRAGQRHDTLPVGRDPKVTTPCGKVLHVESAFLVETPCDVRVPVSLTRQALSRSHAD
jgi:hypothetical protein